MGLANFCVPDAEFDAEVQRLCADILANSRRSNREMKKLIVDTEGMPLAAGIAWELHRFPGHGPISRRGSRSCARPKGPSA